MDKTKHCQGCRQDFYNGKNDRGITECWHLKGARVVTRYRIGWWTPCDKAENFRKVKTYPCHSAPGQYADYERLPDHLR
jgi:hypothetical protein